MQLKILLALRILMPKILRAEETAQAELNIESPMTEITEVLEETNVISPISIRGSSLHWRSSFISSVTP